MADIRALESAAVSRELFTNPTSDRRFGRETFVIGASADDVFLPVDLQATHAAVSPSSITSGSNCSAVTIAFSSGSSKPTRCR